jgi:serine/threonine protein kinase
MLTRDSDLQPGNIMLSIKDQSLLDQIVDAVWPTPTKSKLLGENRIRYSVALGILDDDGMPTISDFGEAHFGDPPFCAEVMPDLYRAPEVILGIPFDNKIDIWSLGLMVRDAPSSPLPLHSVL